MYVFLLLFSTVELNISVLQDVQEDTIQLEESEHVYKDKLKHLEKKVISNPNPLICYFLDRYMLE